MEALARHRDFLANRPVRTSLAALLFPILGCCWWILASGAPCSAAQSDEADPTPEAIGEPGSVHVATAVGALTDSLPITVSPGRRNMEPKIVLSYSSSGGQGILGLGWQLDLGRVEKWRGEGVPAANVTNSFGYSLVGAGGELIDAGDGVYRARIENAYRTFVRKGDGWEMYGGEGIVHRFGSSPGSRVSNQRWLLDQVEDAHGNTITYAYANIAGMVCPVGIRYTGYAPDGDPGANNVVFEYEARPDVRSTYGGLVDENGQPVREQLAHRLQRISVYAAGVLTRRYELEYAQHELNGQSLLARVTLVGSDDSSRITLRTFGYGTRTLGWDDGAAPHGFPVDLADKEGQDTGSRVLDVNGDNLADVIDADAGTVWLGNGQGGFAPDAAWSASLAAAGVAFIDDKGADTGVRLIDVDANGLPDLFVAMFDRRDVWLNHGLGWSPSSEWTASLRSLNGPVRYDPNFSGSLGDCTPPHCGGAWGTFAGCTPPHCTGSTDDPPDCVGPQCDAQGLPKGCLPPECTYKPEYSGVDEQGLTLVGDQGDAQGVELADVNGDGRVDVLWSMRSSEGLHYHARRRPVLVRAVYLNTGHGWERHAGLSTALQPFEFVTDSHVNGYDLLDVNGDGLADILRTRKDQAADERAVFLGTGHGWTKDPAYSASLIDNDMVSLKYVDTGGGMEAQAQGLAPADLNEDGLVDYVMANETGTRAFRNTGTAWVDDPELAGLFTAHGLVFVEDQGRDSSGVVFAQVDGDGLPDIVDARDGVRRIHYASGLRSGLMASATSALGEVTTVGWGMSASLDNLGADGIEHLPFTLPVVTSLTLDQGRGRVFATGFHYRGGLYEDRRFRGFRETTETQPSGLRIHARHHQTEELAGQVELTLVYDSTGRLRERHFSGHSIVPSGSAVRQVLPVRTEEELIEAGQVRRTTILYSYDERMNPVSIRKDPEAGVPGDETTLNFSWVVNEAAGIWSLPRTTTTLGPQGQVLAASIFAYDNLPEGQVDKGRATSVRDLVQEGAYVSRGMEYDRHGNVIAYRDRAGARHEFGYDATGTFRTSAVDPEGRETFAAYDPRFGLEVTSINASGNRTTRTYDAFGRLAKIVMPGDETAPDGTRSYAYSPLGDPGGQHYLLSETQSPHEPETLDTRQFFDSTGKIYRVEREGPDGRTVVTMNEFDDKGNPVSVTLPFFAGDEPRTSIITRDEFRRPVRIVDSDGYETTLTYAGSRVDQVDRGGRTTSYWRNVDGKITVVTGRVDGKEHTTRYAYDVLGRLTGITDALGAVTTIAYDALGRRTRLDDPNTGEYRYHYDDAGRLVAQVSPGNETTAFRYNHAGDLLQKRFADGSVVTYAYGEPGDPNAVGLAVRIEDAAGAVRISYDARGNVIERRRTVTGTTFLTGYAYDSMNRLRRVTYPDGYVVNYGYDKLSNVDQLIDGEGRKIAAGLGHNASGQLLAITYGNGITSRFSYGEMTQMDGIETRTRAGEAIQDLSYRYDPRGNVLAIEDGVSGNSQSFAYDDAGRLTRAGGVYGERVYEYDAVGNLLRKGGLLFEMDPLHPQRVVGARHLDAGSPGKKSSFAVAYDLRGNVTAKSGRRYEYSAENRMVRVLDAKGKVLEENAYDASGQRVLRRTRSEDVILIDGIYERGTTHDARHVYAGPLLVSTIVTPRAQVHLIKKIEPSFLGRAEPGLGHGWTALARRHTRTLGAGGAMGAFLAAFLLMPRAARRRIGEEAGEAGRRASTRPLSTLAIALLVPVFLVVTSVEAGAALGRRTAAAPPSSANSTKRFYYHSNHLGSVNVVTDQEGRVVETRDYTPYGEPVDWSGPNSGPRELLLTFNGHRYDDTSGLYYFGARYYDAELGRFLTADTVVPDPVNPKTLNRYAFGHGNPIRFSDPTGHAVFDIIFGVLVGVAAVVMLGLSLAVSILSFGTLGWVGAIGVGLFTFVIGGLAVAFVGATTAAGFAIWYRATAGEKFTAEGFRQAVFSGFLLGTVVALGAIALVLSFVPGVSGFMGFVGSVLLATVVGAGISGLSTTISHFVFKGGGPESVFWALVAGMAWGAAFGAVSGAVGSGATSLTSWVLSLGNTGSNVLGVVAGLAGLSWDVTDSFVLPFVGHGHSVGGLCQMALSTAVTGAASLGALVFRYDTSFADSAVWDAFFRGATLEDYLNPQPRPR